MKNSTLIFAVLAVMIAGPATACWFEDPDWDPGHGETIADSPFFSEYAKNLYEGETTRGKALDFGPNRTTEIRYVDDSGATVTVKTIIRDGYKREEKTREYIDLDTGYRVVEFDYYVEGRLPPYIVDYEVRYQGYTRIFDEMGREVYKREYGEGVSYKEWDYDILRQNRITDVVVAFDENGDVISITKIETTTTDEWTKTPVPVIDPVTGEPVIDPETGEPIVEIIISPPAKKVTTETSTTTNDPVTGGSTTETETITEDASGNVVETSTQISQTTPDPETGSSTTTSETIKRDSDGNVTETVTETSTTTITNPETGGSTTATETIKKDGDGNTTETVATTETVTPNPATQVTVTVTHTETRDADGNLIEQTTTRWSTCGICEAEGDWLVCPNASQTCPDCTQSLHGVYSHNCPGVPTNPTLPDPGTNPQESGQPDPTPSPDIARFFFARVNQQDIAKPVGTTYVVDLPMAVYVASTMGAAPLARTIYLHCVPDQITSGASYEAAVTSATTGNFQPPAPPVLLFGRSLYPNLSPIKGTGTWAPGDEFLLILSEDPDTEDALVEVDNCCDGAGCRYHIRARFIENTKPGR